MSSIKDWPFFCSWSGGKDSCLALYRAFRGGGRPRFLLTMLAEGGQRSRAHGLPVTVIGRQSSALGIPLITRATSWDDYEATFIAALRKLKEDGVGVGVFGDIDVDAHREWVERVCSSAAIRPRLPLWKEDRHTLLEELIEVGFKATIIAVKEGVLDGRFLGKTLDLGVVREIKAAGIDASGEQGEYHTVVTDGPIFSAPLRLDIRGQIARGGYRFLDASPITGDARHRSADN